MRALYASVILLSVLYPLSTSAAELCRDVKVVIGQAASHFAEIAGTRDAAGERQTSKPLSNAGACRIHGRDAKSWYRCTWDFPLRSEQAYKAFEDFGIEMDSCLAEAEIETDRSVNHPDFYALRRYLLEGVEVGLSVKDKGALGSTFVVIKVQGR